MQDCVNVTGLILKAEPMGEYDRRVLILTKERGKIAAFAKGARRPGSRLMAASVPFCFGEFRLYEGRNSYNMTEAVISNYFEELKMDFEGACYGMYFLEICDYCARENNDEKELLKLLYQSLKALRVKSLSRELVKSIFEIKTIVVNGEFPGLPKEGVYHPSTQYALDYIANAPIEKLYTFTVTQEVLLQLQKIARLYKKNFLPGHFKSLEILESLT